MDLQDAADTFELSQEVATKYDEYKTEFDGKTTTYETHETNLDSAAQALSTANEMGAGSAKNSAIAAAQGNIDTATSAMTTLEDELRISEINY